jgi:hypothetical protein
MRQASRKLNHFILAILALNSASAYAGIVPSSSARKYTRSSSLPRVLSDFNMVRLFKIQSGGDLLASTNTPVESLNRELQFRFKADLEIPADGIYRLGTGCHLRSLDPANSARSYFWTALRGGYSHTVRAGTELVVQKIGLRPGQLRAELSRSKTAAAEIELVCSNPKIQEWTVTSFEIRTKGVLELRSNIQRDPATESHAYALPGLSLSELAGHEYNGYFGSGLPGTSGIQLLIGSNPQAFAHNDNRALWVGNRCAVIGEENPSNTAQYNKDSKFAYQGRVVDSEQGKVQFQFRNWGYSLETLTVECSGTPSEVLAMTTAQVEADLNQSVHFYNK